MKIVDRYILRGFIFSFLVVFVAMVALTIMVDMVMNLDEFFKAVSSLVLFKRAMVKAALTSMTAPQSNWKYSNVR